MERAKIPIFDMETQVILIDTREDTQRKLCINKEKNDERIHYPHIISGHSPNFPKWQFKVDAESFA